MHASHWVQIAAAAVIGYSGVFLLARLDVPNIERGGIVGVLSAADLLFFSALLTIALTLASIYGGDDRHTG
jgi:hypothetical protein